MNIHFFDGAIPRVFGNGLLGSAVTGLLRIPAFLSCCIAVMMVGELAIRALGSLLRGIGLRPADDSWIQRVANRLNSYGVRPYEDMPLKDLSIRMFAFAILGILGSELMRILGGAAPPVYNSILAFLGPIRIDTRPYLAGVREVLAAAGFR